MTEIRSVTLYLTNESKGANRIVSRVETKSNQKVSLLLLSSNTGTVYDSLLDVPLCRLREEGVAWLPLLSCEGVNTGLKGDCGSEEEELRRYVNSSIFFS